MGNTQPLPTGASRTIEIVILVSVQSVVGAIHVFFMVPFGFYNG